MQKLKIKNRCFLLCFVLISFFPFLVNAFQDVSLELIQNFTVNGLTESDFRTKVEYELIPVKGNVLPEGATGKYRFSVNKNDKYILELKNFPNAGEYSYKLNLLSPMGEKYQYNTTTYIIDVFVSNNGTSFATVNKGEEKTNSINFDITYNGKKPGIIDVISPETSDSIYIFLILFIISFAVILYFIYRKVKKY